MKRKLKEKISLFIVMNPRGAVLAGILLLNVALVLISSLLIKNLMQETVGDVGYLRTIYYTICMMLDAGTIENVIADVGTANIVLVIICIGTIILGMITFTGAAIGYVTNYIANFIENANSYARPIHISDHTVILNWNSRASEIINDMLYLNKKETIVVLVNNNLEEVKREINERLYLTLKSEKNLKNLLKIVVREGNTYSSKQLNDISLQYAKTVIILGEDDTDRNEGLTEVGSENMKENANTIKTLVQVAEITSLETSMDNQKIIVEVEDSWTESVVKKIIAHKERLGKCNIVPVPVSKVLGQLLSQFCIFPELNQTYSELLSNKGASFFNTSVDQSKIGSPEKEKDYIRDVLYKNDDVIPLSFMTSKTGRYLYYMANTEKDLKTEEKVGKPGISVDINKDYWLEQKNVIILGHNSKIKSIMDGFDSFRSEWNRSGEEIIHIMIIDDSESLKKNDFFKDYPYVEKVVVAEIYETELIKKSINEFVDAREEDTSILILSDDMVPENDIDSYALTNLIYVQNLIFEKLRDNPDFDRDKIDLIVEILNPKNYDVVHNYNISNIVISNRYISKMITQIGEKIELYEFYEDAFTYDEIADADKANDMQVYESKELYVKKVNEFLNDIPKKCTALELIRAMYEASPEDNKTFLLGIARPGGVVEMFDGRQSDKIVELTDRDKLIMYCNH